MSYIWPKFKLSTTYLESHAPLPSSHIHTWTDKPWPSTIKLICVFHIRYRQLPGLIILGWWGWMDRQTATCIRASQTDGPIISTITGIKWQCLSAAVELPAKSMSMGDDAATVSDVLRDSIAALTPSLPSSQAVRASRESKSPSTDLPDEVASGSLASERADLASQRDIIRIMSTAPNWQSAGSTLSLQSAISTELSQTRVR